jgi:hypothetical protein
MTGSYVHPDTGHVAPSGVCAFTAVPVEALYKTAVVSQQQFEQQTASNEPQQEMRMHNGG